MGTLGLVWRVATGPIWILWSGYKGLWWVFGDTHEPAAPKAQAKGPAKDAFAGAPAADDQRTAFEVVDSSPKPIAPPIRTLRGGFVGSLLASIGMLLATNGMAAAGVMSPERAMVGWLWGSALISVASVLMVRQVARRNRRKRGLSSMLQSVKGAAGDAVAGARGACRWAAERAAKGVQAGAAQVASINQPREAKAPERCSVGSSAATLRSRARRFWSSIGRGTTETRTAA